MPNAVNATSQTIATVPDIRPDRNRTIVGAAESSHVIAPAIRIQPSADIGPIVWAAGTAGACREDVLHLVYDIEIEDAAGRVFTWLTGRLPVTPQVTA